MESDSDSDSDIGSESGREAEIQRKTKIQRNVSMNIKYMEMELMSDCNKDVPVAFNFIPACQSAPLPLSSSPSL